MRIISILLSVLLLALGQVHLAQASLIPETPLSKAVTYKDSNKPIVLTKAQPDFTIRFQSNPTTGYHWFLTSYDDRLISPLKSTYKAPKEGAPGAGGYEDWKFTATPNALAVPGRTNLTFVYARSWELSVAKKRSFIVFLSP